MTERPAADPYFCSPRPSPARGADNRLPLSLSSARSDASAWRESATLATFGPPRAAASSMTLGGTSAFLAQPLPTCATGEGLPGDAPLTAARAPSSQPTTRRHCAAQGRAGAQRLSQHVVWFPPNAFDGDTAAGRFTAARQAASRSAGAFAQSPWSALAVARHVPARNAQQASRWPRWRVRGSGGLPTPGDGKHEGLSPAYPASPRAPSSTISWGSDGTSGTLTRTRPRRRRTVRGGAPLPPRCPRALIPNPPDTISKRRPPPNRPATVRRHPRRETAATWRSRASSASAATASARVAASGSGVDSATTAAAALADRPRNDIFPDIFFAPPDGARVIARIAASTSLAPRCPRSARPTESAGCGVHDPPPPGRGLPGTPRR